MTDIACSQDDTTLSECEGIFMVNGSQIGEDSIWLHCSNKTGIITRVKLMTLYAMTDD